MTLSEDDRDHDKVHQIGAYSPCRAPTGVASRQEARLTPQLSKIFHRTRQPGKWVIAAKFPDQGQEPRADSQRAICRNRPRIQR